MQISLYVCLYAIWFHALRLHFLNTIESLYKGILMCEASRLRDPIAGYTNTDKATYWLRRTQFESRS